MELWSDFNIINDVDGSVTKAHRIIFSSIPFFAKMIEPSSPFYVDGDLHIEADPTGWRIACDFIYWSHSLVMKCQRADLFANRYNGPYYTNEELALCVEVLDQFQIHPFASHLANTIDMTNFSFDQLEYFSHIPTMTEYVLSTALVVHDLTKIERKDHPTFYDAIRLNLLEVIKTNGDFEILQSSTYTEETSLKDIVNALCSIPRGNYLTFGLKTPEQKSEIFETIADTGVTIEEKETLRCIHAITFWVLNHWPNLVNGTFLVRKDTCNISWIRLWLNSHEIVPMKQIASMIKSIMCKTNKYYIIYLSALILLKVPVPVSDKVARLLEVTADKLLKADHPDYTSISKALEQRALS